MNIRYFFDYNFLLPVNIRHDVIDGADNDDKIRHQVPHGHQGQGLDVGKPRGPDAHPVGHGAAVADYVEALFAPGMLRGGIGLAPGELWAPG